MDLIIDANVLFAALIKDGITARLLFEENLHLFTPEFLLEEFEKHKDYILKKTHRTNDEFDLILEVILSRITFIPKEEIVDLMGTAEKISPDSDDSIYFAAAMRIGASIWSNESRLKNQRKIKIYTTSDLIKIFQIEII